MAIPFHFPVNGEYLITIRLRRQYQDYIMGMGWPQQVDVRVDGRLLKRFTIGGNAPGRPAAASYAGDGEPGFAGAPEWEAFMQLTADAGLQVRVPIDAGSRIVGVSFVRQLFEPEGLPQPLQRGRVLTNDQIYMENASIGSVQIGGPFTVTGTAKDTASRRAIFTLPARERGRPGVRHLDPVARRQARVSPAGGAGRREDAAGVLRRRRPRRRHVRQRGSSSRSSGCWSIPIFCCGSITSRRTSRPRRTGSATSSWRRGSRSSCGAAFRTIG